MAFAMKAVLTCSLLALLLLQHVPCCCHSFLHQVHTGLRLLQEESPLYMQQMLDHFNPQDKRTFQQRYYEYLNYFEAPYGPIFLEVCGEAECEGTGDTFYMTLAQEMNATYVTLEHRYYGASIPTPDLSTKNLAYLSSSQALFDLANFRNYYQEKLRQKYNLSQSFENAWVVLGCSYASALSAWFRLKFPHLVRGSISSSGVINSITNYQAYDEQLGESLGPECGPLFMEITRRLEKGLRENATYIKSLFNATKQDDGSFAQLMAYIPGQYTQYGGQDIPCKPILHAFHEGRDILEAYVDAFPRLYGSLDEFPSATKSHNKDYDNGRQWIYQQCSELGLFSTAASKNNIFMHSLNLKYWSKNCASAFGNGTYPNTEHTNLNYGGTRISGSRILFINASQDPWRHASKKTSTSSEESVLITCRNCAHCVDMSGCYPFGSRGDPSSCSSPENVTMARNIMRMSLKAWIGSKH